MQRRLEGEAWSRLRRLGIPEAATSFLHGDFWTGNLLFEAERVTGIVDWGDAGYGPAGLELGHFRAELVIGTGSEEPAEAMVSAYEAQRGPMADRAWWEVAGFLLFPSDPAAWLPSWTEADLPMTADLARSRHAVGLAAAWGRLG